VILSDIFQSGLPKEELYDKVADLIIAHKIDRVIGIVKPFRHSKLNLRMQLLMKHS
jgi:alanine racemase